MGRTIALIAFAAINAAIIPAAFASECTLNRDIGASRARWAMVRRQPANTTDTEKACRAYATSFYESVTLRQAAAKCSDSGRELVDLDSEINAFNELLATKCSD